MIRNWVPETGIRKTDEQGVYEAVERGQRKTMGETRCATCQCPQVYTQEIGTEGLIYQKPLSPNSAWFLKRKKNIGVPIRPSTKRVSIAVTDAR